MTEKYKILKQLIGEWIERETENLIDIRKTNGVNCVAYGMASGALDAYKQVLSDIEELESEGVIND